MPAKIQIHHLAGGCTIPLVCLVTITIAALGVYPKSGVVPGRAVDSTTTVIYQAVLNGFDKQNIAYGSAISVVFFIMVMSVAIIQRYLTREKNAA
jgi:ABC-type sugar transport system permease subunit